MALSLRFVVQGRPPAKSQPKSLRGFKPRNNVAGADGRLLGTALKSVYDCLWALSRLVTLIDTIAASSADQ
jgi:hypothetical protein